VVQRRSQLPFPLLGRPARALTRPPPRRRPQKYQDMHEQDKKRYEREMAACVPPQCTSPGMP
jgi:hypothetical protein